MSEQTETHFIIGFGLELIGYWILSPHFFHSNENLKKLKKNLVYLYMQKTVHLDTNKKKKLNFNIY